MTPENKTAAVAATTTTENSSNYQEAQTDNDTRPAVTAWNRAVSGEAIPQAPHTSDLRWGRDLEHVPDWASHLNRSGVACSDHVTVNAQQYDEDSPDNRGGMRTTRGKVKVSVVQAAEEVFPTVLVEVLKLGRTSKGSRAVGTISPIRVYAHELPALIEALSTARDLVGEGK